ncbi:MAG: hypothetical protein OEM94_07160 [Acidimicrobiia bacterium]|nr:hypothetical protein [Acidimicrobiia bacterium]
MSTPQTEAGYPWHFWLLIGAAGLYLGLRLVQGIVALIQWIS